MVKRILSIVLTICVLVSVLSVFPTMVFAATSGTCGTNLTWILENGTLTISGSGDMDGYSTNEYAPWYYSRKAITQIVFDGDITSIGTKTFYGCSNLVNITLPESVTYIGTYSFMGCTSLESINIPNSVKTIDSMAFIDCSNLKSLTIPASVTNIYNDKGSAGIFNGCVSLTDIFVDEKNPHYTDVDGVLFDKKMTRLIRYPGGKYNDVYKIPDGVTSIGDNAFHSSVKVKSIDIPSSLKTISQHAFGKCSSLTDITIPISVTEIGLSAFRGCTNLANIIINANISRIYYNMFQGCTNLKNISVPSTVTKIDDDAFDECFNLTDVYYSGSKNDWIGIDIGLSNTYLTSATIHYNYTGNYEYDVDHSIDDYIIGEVKKYTSSGDLAQYNAIMSSDASWEEKFRRLNEFFNNEGLTDIKEGTQYLTESNSYRYAYNCLTTNEMYGAFNYYNWLYSTKSGLAARSALYASGLIFNFEAFSYMDLSTYTENDYPGVKKNKKLLKEIMGVDDNNAVCDTFDYSNKVVKFLDNVLKLNDAIEAEELLLLKNQILNTESIPEKEKLLTQYCDLVIKQIGEDKGNGLYFLSDNFSNILKTTGSILEFGDATAEDIVSLVKLDADIETYKKYNRFLSTIYNTPEVSFEMRLAAYQLLDDIENGFYNKAVALLTNVIKLSGDLMYTDKTMLETFLESQGISESGSGLFADALGTLKLATTISNIIVDTGDFVEQVAYTQGYAELATLYSLKLEEDKQAFLTNETAENAWKFFEDYTMLWKLRYNGEQQYLDMSEVKVFVLGKIKTYKYEEKNEVVQDNLEMLNKCKFKLTAETTIPISVQYEKKSVVKCPVDVYVYNSEGTLIATLKDGEESDVTNNYGRFTVVKESYSGEYAKVICQSTTEDLTIKMIAVDDGLVDYQSLATDSTDVKTMDKLMVVTGNAVEVTDNQYIIDADLDGDIDISGELIIKDSNDYIPIESATLTENNISLMCGETKNIGIKILPENATNTSVDWISLDESVACVKNGLVTAVAPGTTTIFAKVCDSNEIECALNVMVTGTIKIDGNEMIINDKVTLGNELEDGYSLPDNVVGYYINADGITSLVPAGSYRVKDKSIINTVYVNIAMVNGAQVRYGCGLDDNGKINSGNGLRFLATVDRSNFDGEGYGMKITAEGNNEETIVEATKWQNDTMFSVAITNMPESNFIRKFTATPFVKVKYYDGTEKTIYGKESVTRSIYQVASGLLATGSAEDEKELIEVLNAYANQTGIRLVIKDDTLKANTNYTTNGAYNLEEGELHFEVSGAEYDKASDTYSVILTPRGNAEILTDNNFWYDYIRINNNNSLVKDKVTMEPVADNEKAVKVTFKVDGLIKRPADDDADNITPDPFDDEFDPETENFQ